MDRCSLRARSKRRVNLLAPLEEGVWLSAEQLETCWGKSVGHGLAKTEPPAPPAPPTRVTWEPPDAPESRAKETLQAWVQEASHWESDNSQRSQRPEPELFEAETDFVQGLPERSTDPSRLPDAQGRVSDPVPTASRSADLPDLTGSGKGRAVMMRMDSCHSSQSSFSHASREDTCGRGLPSFRECRYGSMQRSSGADDVHAAARRSLEESARRSYGDPVLSPQQRKEKASRLKRFFKSSPKQ